MSDIERELSRSGFRLRFALPSLERAFSDRQREEARPYNRFIVALTVLLFDLFIFGEMKTSPETLLLSVWLRFALMTPLTAAFIAIDWRRAVNAWAGRAAALLLVLPTVMSAILSAHTTSPDALLNFAAVPLIQLSFLTCRLSLRLVIVASLVSTALFIHTALTVSFVQSSQIPAALLTDASITIAVLAFATRLDVRDRQVFLLNLQADIKNDLLACQNVTLSRLTQIDALTGLGNRRCFDETLGALWASERYLRADIALIMFDIDCFKLFNDSFGHQAGDECLATLGHAAARCLRDDKDTLVRYGGEEFAIILPSTSLAEGWSIAERVRQAVLDRAVPQTGLNKVVTVSLGVACVKPSEQSAAALIERADRCLYAAKRDGRNRTVADDAMLDIDPFPMPRGQGSEASPLVSGDSLATGRG